MKSPDEFGINTTWTPEKEAEVKEMERVAEHYFSQPGVTVMKTIMMTSEHTKDVWNEFRARCDRAGWHTSVERGIHLTVEAPARA